MRNNYVFYMIIVTLFIMKKQFPPNFIEENRDVDLLRKIPISDKEIKFENDIDIEEIIMWGFKNCFVNKGEISVFEKEGLLVAPGELRNKTESKHDCSLVIYNKSWVWEDQNVLEDRIIYNSSGQRSITLINIKKNDNISIVYCSKSGGKHKVKKSKSFTFNGEILVADDKLMKKAIEH